MKTLIKTNRLFVVLVLQILALCGTLTVANEVIGCGGFIKSNTEINYKIIKVKLLTKDGAVKYTTEASPVNGYYMIPIYNKGDYVLQVNPPLGWSFEPNQVNINVDGHNDPCTKNEDINFFFKGFGLSGKIVTQGDAKNEGPSNIKLNLIQNDKILSTTQSESDGSYYFSNVMPGTYQVEAHDENVKFLKSKVNVVLSKDNWYAKESIAVSGFKIQGLVTSSDKTPIAGALVELFFSDETFSKIDTKDFVCERSARKEAGSLKICETKTDAQGKFSFSNVAFGKYSLKSSLNGDEPLEFAMEPAALVADLTKHQNFMLPQPFVLNSVSIKSSALLSEKTKKALERGEVYVNGKKYSSEIGKDGKFSLDKLTTGSYKIEIKSKSVYFEPKKVEIDLKSAPLVLNKDAIQHKALQSLTKFVAKSFDVCGQVRVNNPSLTGDLIKSVKVRVYSSANNLVTSANLEDNLTYCLELESNQNYVFKAELTGNLGQYLRLVPLERKVNVVDAPLLDVNFQQLESKLEGKIKLAGKQDTDGLSITLNAIDSMQAWSKELQVKCLQSASEASVVECPFSLSNLLFGKYELTTNYDDILCWKDQSADNRLIINVDSELQKVVIEQVGYKLNYKFSHANVNFKIVEAAKRDKVLLSKSLLSAGELTNSVCLSKNNYVMLIDSCHKFTATNEPDAIEISSNVFKKGSNTLVFTALKHKLTVDVVFKLDDELLLNDKNVLSERDLSVEAFSSDQQAQKLDTIKFKLKSEDKEKLVFTGHGWFSASKSIRLAARSDKVLFEKNNLELRIDETTCDKNALRFEAKLGIFITGKINPSNIDSIDLVVRSTEDNSTLEKVVVNATSPFRLGPYKAPFSLYAVELSKSGYLFNKLTTDTNNKNTYSIEYQAQKLGQLKVNVVDAKLKTSLESVLLSLSSENRLFRQTIKTDANGLVSFDNLKPGLYYLIVMMQEYEFKPNSHPIQITDGFNMNLVVEADRIAYSCFGRVTSINGKAESDDLLVEAVGLKSDLDINLENDLCKSSRENSELDKGLGTYRIRNLKPSCIYELNVKNFKSEKPVLNIVPMKFLFKVNDSDILDRNFIVLNRNEHVDVSVALSYLPASDLDIIGNLKQHNNFVRVKLFKTSQPESILQTQYSPANSIIYFNPIFKDHSQQYSILAELLVPSTISVFSALTQHQIGQLQQLPAIDKTEVSFHADCTHKHFTVKFDLDRKRSSSAYFNDLRQQQYQNFYFTLPLFILLVGIVFNTKLFKKKLNDLSGSIQQKGGLVKYIQSFQRERSETPSSSSTKAVSKSSKNARSSTKDQSDTEKSKPQQVQQQSPQQQSQAQVQAQAQPAPKIKHHVSFSDEKNNSDEQSESDYVDYTSEEGETLTIIKKKPKKI